MQIYTPYLLLLPPNAPRLLRGLLSSTPPRAPYAHGPAQAKVDSVCRSATSLLLASLSE